jgi:hypothetical protein
MARIAIDDFGDKEIALVYFAARLAEAQLVEAELDKNSIEYAVEVESYLTTVIFWISEYKGAAFYVIAEQISLCRQILRDAGLTGGLLEEEFQ